MENLKETISETVFYLQCLMDSSIFLKVQSAVIKKDKDSFLRACKKAKIPNKYIGILATLLLTGVAPAQLVWPPP